MFFPTKGSLWKMRSNWGSSSLRFCYLNASQRQTGRQKENQQHKVKILKCFVKKEDIELHKVGKPQVEKKG